MFRAGIDSCLAFRAGTNFANVRITRRKNFFEEFKNDNNPVNNV